MGDCNGLVTIASSNHYETLVKGLWNSLTSQLGVDFNFEFDGRMIRVHQVVVNAFLSPECIPALSSPQLPVTIYEETFQEAHQTVVEDNIIIDDNVSTHNANIADNLHSSNQANQLSEQNGVHHNEQTGNLHNQQIGGCENVESENIDNFKTGSLDNFQTDHLGKSLEKETDSNQLQTKYYFDNNQICTSDNTVQDNHQTGNALYPPSIEPDNLDSILEFIYTGKVTLQLNRLDELYDAAKRLNFIMLVDAVESYRREASGMEKVATAHTEEESVAVDRQGTEVEHQLKERVCDSMESSATTNDELEALPKAISKKKKKLCLNPPVKCRLSERNIQSSSIAVPVKPITGMPGRPMFRCQQCGYGTRYKTLFQHHQAKHDSNIPVFRCSSCSRPFLSDAALQRHLLANTCLTGLFQCPHCDYKNINKHSFQLHVTRHDSSLPFFRCEACGVPFLDETALERHKLKHVGSPLVYQCTHCSFVTPKFRGFRHHLINLHGVDENGVAVDKKFKCAQCPNSYVYESELKYHVTTRHCSDRPHKCELCSFCSSRKADVSKHVKIAHLGIKKYMCETCGFRAVTPYNLERHKVSHTGLKPYSCNICDQAYGDPGSLKRHLDRHSSDEKKFVCHLCAHSTRRGDHLKKHLKNVHKIT